MMPDEYAEYEQPDAELVEVEAPAPELKARQWSWSPSMLLWAAAAVVVVGFIVYLVMGYSSARARFFAEVVSTNDGSDAGA